MQHDIETHEENVNSASNIEPELETLGVQKLKKLLSIYLTHV